MTQSFPDHGNPGNKLPKKMANKTKIGQENLLIIYFLLTEFEICAVSCVTGLFPLIYGPRASRLEKTRIPN